MARADGRRRPVRRALIPWCALFLFLPPAGRSQDRPSAEGLEIDAVSFTGNSAFDEGTLKEVIRSKESPGFLTQFVYRAGPERFAGDVFEGDIRRLETFYNDKGYFSAVIGADLEVDSARRRVSLFFSVSEGSRSSVERVEYHGLEQLQADLRAEILKDPAVQAGAPMERAAAESEIARILDGLANNGYPFARYLRDRSYAKRVPATGNFVVSYWFDTGSQYRFGEIGVHVDPPRGDIGENLILRQLDFAPGEVYSREKKISSERNLNRVDIFESARVENLPAGDSSAGHALAVDVFVRPRSQHEISPEIGVSDENGFFNLGVGLGYSNRNFLGDGRTARVRTRARTQSLDVLFQGRGLRDTSVVGAVELQFQLLQPYVFSRSLSGSWTSSLSAEKQKFYVLSILRNKVGLSKQFARYTYGFVDWTLERVNPEILESSTNSQDILSNLRQEDQRQFNSILTLTLQRDRTNDIFSPTEGFFHSASVEESGVLPKLLPGIRAGLPFTQYYKATLYGRWYRDLTSTRYNILATKLKTGYQDKYGESRGLDVKIPLNRRFFAGGGNSVRGWKARELGAMADQLKEFGGNFIIEGSAEMRINYFRGRGKLGWIRLDNVWGVYFVDFGNVWSRVSDFKLRDIAVAAGIGLRYETFFGPFRIDYGFRVYDPQAEGGRTTILERRLFGETLGDAVFHFGIGHAF